MTVLLTKSKLLAKLFLCLHLLYLTGLSITRFDIHYLQFNYFFVNISPNLHLASSEQ